MQTKKLKKAYQETSKLCDFLIPREWYDSPELCGILERADVEISQIVEKAISDVLVKLQGSYTEEARNWAENKQTDINGNPVVITRREQAKAQTELKRINTTVAKLYDILSETS